MRRKIVSVSEPKLRNVSKPVKIIDKRVTKLIKDLKDTLEKQKDPEGVGLAAPQIGISKRVFVTFLDDKVQIYINPEIVRQSEKTNYCRELCLSSGIMSAGVERPESITMKWLDQNGEEHKQEFDGFLARLMQHEFDHLEGVVNLDKAVEGSIEMAIFNPLEEKLRDKP